MSPRSLMLPVTALLVAAALAGCTTPSEGTASVYVKDAPTDHFRSVFVTFTEVSIHQSGSGSDGNGTADNGTDGDAEAGWHVLFSDSTGVTVDLLNASGSRAAFLGEDGLDAGHYQQIRIKVSEAYGVDASGARIEIAVPDKGYVRTSKSFKVEEGKETQIIIDIDLEKALVEKGGQWEFKNKIGKVYTTVKDKADKPDKGDIATVELKDDA